MPRKRKFGSVVDKCRVCLCDDGCMSDIFSDNLRVKIDDLEKSTSISIEDGESLPRNLCHVCLYKLDMWIDFKTQFVRSNDALQKHLLLGDLLDDRAPVAKRKHSDAEIRTEEIDSNAEGAGKQLKSETSAPTSMDIVDLEKNVETVEPSSLNDNPAVMKDSLKDDPDTNKPTEPSQDSEITSEMNPVNSAISSKVKQIIVRRSKTTERRMESTKRWVARKKALLAATGENETDTDSMGSDDDQLSPVQKARAKCNAEKIAETQRRMTTRALQKSNNKLSSFHVTNVEIENQIIHDTETEQRKEKINSNVKTEITKIVVNDVHSSSNNVASTSSLPIANNLNNSIVDDTKKLSNVKNNSLPNSIRSELMVDGATFAVTSTLVLSEPHYLNPTQIIDTSSLTNDETNKEINTDIIDAVQLRRINPINFQTSKFERKMIDTCLNIEVEGTELEALQRVQLELANFVEKDMISIVAGDSRTFDDNDETIKSAFQILDRQLKTIVEKTIRKNLENSKIMKNRGNKTFAGEFLKAAMRSKIFQPRVLLIRQDKKIFNVLNRTSRKRKTNETTEISKNTIKTTSKKIDELPIVPLGKRRSVQPARYADYNTASPYGTDDEDSKITRDVKKTTTDVKTEKIKTYRPALTKSVRSSHIVNSQKNKKSLLLPEKSTFVKKSNNVETTIANVNPTLEKHICGVCGNSYETRNQVEIHFATHKKPQKQKMMRCKRCHAVVEARYVQNHVCESLRNVYKCRTCEATFLNEQLFEKHEETHKIADKRVKLTNDKTEKNETTKIVEQTILNDVEEKNTMKIVTQNRDSYTCFVCDATFTDEEILKDHLQKHCDDMSEDERRNCKDYECAICSETFLSEDVLENHVEKHLFDDEDDNPNLISIGIVDGEKSSIKTEIIHSCGQCSENFDSEMLLMLHMQAHEEEVAIAEWERRGIDNSQVEQHVCVICDDFFATEDELSEHLDVHNGNAHICLLCDKPFLTLEELQSHVNTH